MSKRLLVSFAHPDDESFGLGGVISRYVAEGVEVYLICATNGDVGTVAPEMLNGYKSVAELRLAELACATQKLGFKRVFTFGYKDSGMMGSETTQDPDCLWYAHEHCPEEVVQRVVEAMREIRPHVVVTFNKYGAYGHPDHIAIQRATEEAFNLAGNADYVTGDLQPYQPQKLYYNSFPTLILRMGIWLMRLTGKDPRRMGENNDIDLRAILDHVEPEHARVDIRAYREAWQEANACHKSQGGGVMTRNPILRMLQNLQYRAQGFTRVYPAPDHQHIDETDLFEGVELDESVVDTTQ